MIEPGRHGAGPGRAARRGRTGRPSSSCPGRRASCTRCGRPRSSRASSRPRSPAAPTYEQRHAAAVRDPGVRDRRDAAGGRGGHRRLRAARDHHLPAPRRGRGGGAPRAGRLGCAGTALRRADRASATRETLSPTDGSTRRRAGAELLDGRKIGGGRVLHRRAAGGAADRAAGLLGYFAGGVVSYSNEAKAELLGVDPALIESTGRRVAGGRRGDGRRGARALRCRRGGRDHRRRRPGRGHRGQAGGLRLLVREDAPTGGCSRATSGCPATAPRSATARPPSRCTCSAGCCVARTCRSSDGLDPWDARSWCFDPGGV